MQCLKLWLLCDILFTFKSVIWCHLRTPEELLGFSQGWRQQHWRCARCGWSTWVRYGTCVHMCISSPGMIRWRLEYADRLWTWSGQWTAGGKACAHTQDNSSDFQYVPFLSAGQQLLQLEQSQGKGQLCMELEVSGWSWCNFHKGCLSQILLTRRTAVRTLSIDIPSPVAQPGWGKNRHFHAFPTFPACCACIG